MLRRLAIWKFLKISLVIISTIPIERCVSSSTMSIQPLGSILFEEHGYSKKCFTRNDIAQLATRLKFQELLPTSIEFMSDEEIFAMMKYFYGINEIIDHMSGKDARQLLEKCFYDMLGGYLKHIILPMTKYSFYAGNVTYSVAQNVFNLYDRCKELLDTNGNSWSDPITDFSAFIISIKPLNIPQSSDDEVVKICANLAMNQNDEDNEEDMLVPLPKIETSQDENLSTIWLPLRRKHIFNINSKTSAFILFRYYVMVTQCFQYQGINQSVFNRKLKVWIIENVLPYLDDDQLYPAFGAVLRIMETVKEQNEGIYQGSKEKSRKSHRGDILSMINSNLDEKFGKFSFHIETHDIYWWIYAVALAAGITFAILIIIFLICRFCCNRKKKKSGVDKSSSLTEKLSSIFKSNTHKPEPDEFYEYKKVPSKDLHKKSKIITFENERSKKINLFKKMRSKRKAEQFPLPNLNGSDSEEIVLHQSNLKNPSFTSSSSFVSQKVKPSGEASSSKFLDKIRSLSPSRKKRNQPGDP